jgi:hypothetical protein
MSRLNMILSTHTPKYYLPSACLPVLANALPDIKNPASPGFCHHVQGAACGALTYGLFQQCLRLGHHVLHGETKLFEQLLCRG